jgi:hypothetical protein
MQAAAMAEAERSHEGGGAAYAMRTRGFDQPLIQRLMPVALVLFHEELELIAFHVASGTGPLLKV